jgi:PAS domain S-box-containing protein
MNITQINTLSQEEIRAEMENARALSKNYFVFKHRRANGSIRDVGVFSGPVQRRGQPLLFSIIQDITERKEAEKAFRGSEEKLRLFIDYAPAALTMFDREMRYLAVSRRWLTDYNLADRDIIGQSHYDVFPEIPDRWKSVHRRGLAGEVVRADADHFERLDGTVQWLHWEVRPWYAADGEIGGIVIFTEDITQRKQAEEALRQSEASLRESQRVAHVGHWSWDTATNKVEWSDEMKRIFGLDPDLFAGDLDMVIMQSIHPEDREKVIEANKAVLTEQKPAPTEYRVILADQTVRTVIAIPGNRVTDEHGHILKLTGIVQDITARKQLEEENKKLTAQFYQAQKLDAIGQLAGGIAHDFNNLLVPIIGYAELGMMKLETNEPLHANFTQIKDAADKAAGLTRQILAFSRRQMLEMKPVNLNMVVSDFEKMLSRLLREDITLKIYLYPQLQPVKADKSQIEQVLMNLVINARDAMPTGGTLIIETNLAVLDETYAAQHADARPGQYVLLVVSDTGHGMDAETQQHVFEPFFTTKARGQGTGLGLATVFGIVKQHQGNIWVYSEPGQGTTFKIYLPVAAEPEAPSPVQQSAAPVKKFTGSETVLVVEDQADVRQLVAHTLRAHGYLVLEADGPDQALALAAAHPSIIHLLLTDVIMPRLNGRQLYHRLLQQMPGLRVLYMSGYTDNVIIHHGALDPDIAFLAKPFSVQSLLQKVRVVLDQPAQ